MRHLHAFFLPALMLAPLACDEASLARARSDASRDAHSGPEAAVPDADLLDAETDLGEPRDLGAADAPLLRDSGLDAEAPIDAGDACAMAASESPETPRLLAPYNGANWGSAGASPSSRPRFRWRASARAGCHQIQLGTGCDARDLAACDLGPTPTASTAALEHTPAEPLAVSLEPPVGDRYFWRVRACNGAGCSDWSVVRYLDVGRLPDDLDGDGDSEVIVGCRGCDSADGLAMRIGALLVYDGGPTPDSEPLRFEHPGRQGFSRFGNAVAAGDIDGDGFGDVIVGAPTEATVEGESGAVYWLRGSRDGLVTAPASVTRIISPNPELGGYFGATVAIAGDVDGDGDRDIVIGGPNESPDGNPISGAAYLARGTADGLDPGPPERLARDALPAFSKLGFAVATVGDLDGDGLVEIAASAAGYTPPSTMGTETGRLLLWRGDSLGAHGSAVFIDPAMPAADDIFGASFSGGHDLDDDGLSDVVVGADMRNVGAGKVRVAFGDESTLLRVSAPCSITGLPFGSMFGGTVLSAGDVDGDGLTDALAAAAFAPAPGDLYRVEVARSGRIACDPWIDEPIPLRPAGSRLFYGFALASGDTDGDGILDLVVSSPAIGPFPDDPLPERIWLYRGGPGFPDDPIALPIPFPPGTRPQEIGLSLD